MTLNVPDTLIDLLYPTNSPRIFQCNRPTIKRWLHSRGHQPFEHDLDANSLGRSLAVNADFAKQVTFISQHLEVSERYVAGLNIIRVASLVMTCSLPIMILCGMSAVLSQPFCISWDAYAAPSEIRAILLPHLTPMHPRHHRPCPRRLFKSSNGGVPFQLLAISPTVVSPSKSGLGTPSQA